MKNEQKQKLRGERREFGRSRIVLKVTYYGSVLHCGVLGLVGR